MIKIFPLALLPLVLVLGLCLTTPAWASGESAATLRTTSSEDLLNTETIPGEILTGSDFQHLNRLVFRYEMVRFDTDSSHILPESRWALDRKARWLKEYPEATVLIEGHCDVRGTADYNKALGARRAAAARAFLIEQDISPDRIRIVSLGKERPDVLGSGARIWFYNRRVEFLPR